MPGSSTPPERLADVGKGYLVRPVLNGVMKPAGQQQSLFSNDGNFMQRFLQQQALSQEKKTGATAVASASASTATPAAAPAAAEVAGAAPGAGGSDAISEEARRAIEKCASWVAQHGAAFEQTLREKNKGNPAFCFLENGAPPNITNPTRHPRGPVWAMA
jgi:hypothetical protein